MGLQMDSAECNVIIVVILTTVKKHTQSITMNAKVIAEEKKVDVSESFDLVPVQ